MFGNLKPESVYEKYYARIICAKLRQMPVGCCEQGAKIQLYSGTLLHVATIVNVNVFVN